MNLWNFSDPQLQFWQTKIFSNLVSFAQLSQGKYYEEGTGKVYCRIEFAKNVLWKIVGFLNKFGYANSVCEQWTLSNDNLHNMLFRLWLIQIFATWFIWQTYQFWTIPPKYKDIPEIFIKEMIWYCAHGLASMETANLIKLFEASKLSETKSPVIVAIMVVMIMILQISYHSQI